MTRHTALSGRIASCRVCLALAASVSVFLCAGTSHAAYTLDRWYQFGDDSLEDASDGIDVGTGASSPAQGFTFDSVGTSSQVSPPGSFDDLMVFGAGSSGEPGEGLPTYVDISSDRPVSGNTDNNFAVQLDGINDYFEAVTFNNPSQSTAAPVEGYDSPNVIVDRGYQFWFKTATPETGTIQVIVDDADEHISRLGALGAVNSGYGNDNNANINNTGVTPAADTWTHVMQVRPFGASQGSWSYVNGIATDSHSGDYTTTLGTILPLRIGANVEPDAGSPSAPNQFYGGIVDDLQMFVLGGGFGDFDYTEDNGYFTDVFLPQQSGYGFTLDTNTGHNSQTWVDGDINFDGVLNQADVDQFVASWLSESANLPGDGQQIGDYVTLGLGDLDLDGDTDLADFFALRALDPIGALNFSAAVAVVTGVPEPSSVSLLFLAGCCAANRARRNP